MVVWGFFCFFNLSVHFVDFSFWVVQDGFPFSSWTRGEPFRNAVLWFSAEFLLVLAVNGTFKYLPGWSRRLVHLSYFCLSFKWLWEKTIQSTKSINQELCAYIKFKLDAILSQFWKKMRVAKWGRIFTENLLREKNMKKQGCEKDHANTLEFFGDNWHYFNYYSK